MLRNQPELQKNTGSLALHHLSGINALNTLLFYNYTHQPAAFMTTATGVTTSVSSIKSITIIRFNSHTLFRARYCGCLFATPNCCYKVISKTIPASFILLLQPNGFNFAFTFFRKSRTWFIPTVVQGLTIISQPSILHCGLPCTKRRTYSSTGW